MQIDAQKQRLDVLRRLAAQQAADRYDDNWQEISRTREGIALVKQDKLPLLSLDDNHQRTALRLQREQTDDPVEAQERVNNSNNIQEAWIADELWRLKAAVCRISLAGQAIGTGFLVADGVILTNNHVIPDEQTALQLTAEFGYELNKSRVLAKICAVKLRPDLLFQTSSIEQQNDVPHSGLDYTLVAIEAAPELAQAPGCRFPAAELDGTQGKVVVGEQCVIYQHPAGEPKKVVLQDIALLRFTEQHMIYESDTLPGSSGSMIIALGTGEVIGLHHSGVPQRDEAGNTLTKSGAIAIPGITPDDQVNWIGNEGIRISCIIDAFEQVALPQSMESMRTLVLKRTRQLRGAAALPLISSQKESDAASNIISTTQAVQAMPDNNSPQPLSSAGTQLQTFTLVINNEERDIAAVNRFLSARYGVPVSVVLQMPMSARKGASELFTFTATISGNAADEAATISRLPQVLAAEPDDSMYLNSGETPKPMVPVMNVTESAIVDKAWEDGYSLWNEDDYRDEQGRLQTGFLHRWADCKDYVFPDDLQKTRKWNQHATGFHNIKKADYDLLDDAHIVVAHLDTGYTHHSKVEGGFDIQHGYDEVGDDNNAADERQPGYIRFPGHGTRTGSLLIGRNTEGGLPHEGNSGMMQSGKSRIIPFRIAKTVILLNRQKELTAAVDKAISGGADVLSMSMGTVPTIATALAARKAYDAGKIWCCAAGNQVKFVVAPAVFPGTIAVAASNPKKEPWSGSSFGDAVDITAPGEDVYVPIWARTPDGDAEDFAYGDGTSYATPHITAAAALWLAKYKHVLDAYPKDQPWKKVEAFRRCLKSSAQKGEKHNLPTTGFGDGILDVDALLHSDEGSPETFNHTELTHAYNGWNEHAFFAALQGWGELTKTYWHLFHHAIGRIFGAKESVELPMAAGAPLSDTARQQEAALFPAGAALESAGPASLPQLEGLYRLQELNQLIIHSAKP